VHFEIGSDPAEFDVQEPGFGKDADDQNTELGWILPHNASWSLKPGGASASGYVAGTVAIASSGHVEIFGDETKSVVFEGKTGTLKLDHSIAFRGDISGLAESDELDLSDIKYDAGTTATYLGTSGGGTLTVNDGQHTAHIKLLGNYLSSSWTLTSDGHGGTVVVDPVVDANWEPIKIGAGGFVTGIDIAPDDTMVVRTDTYGAYLWNGVKWQQLVTASSMPAADVAIYHNAGVYEIRIAPSNSNILYMAYLGNVYRSNNKGATWTKTAFPHVSEDANDVYRMNGQKMAVDPHSPNVVCGHAAKWPLGYHRRRLNLAYG
jgi:hypothetical protein